MSWTVSLTGPRETRHGNVMPDFVSYLLNPTTNQKGKNR